MPFPNRPRGWERTQKRIIARDRGICWLCGKVGATTVDHVVPRVNGGGHEDANLRAACLSCNSRKGSRDSLPVGPLKKRLPRYRPGASVLPRARQSQWG